VAGEKGLNGQMAKSVKIGSIEVGEAHQFLLIAGPCVIESRRQTLEVASYLKDITGKLEIPFIFKASYDKANRTSLNAYRGPGRQEGLDILAEVRETLQIPVLSDVHRTEEIEAAAEVLDMLQIPAFLCRQTDLLLAAGKTGRPINIKKGQFLAPWDVPHVVAKLLSTGNDQFLITERGTSFGYNNLVVDFRSISLMRSSGYPVIFDATHSVQLPGGAGGSSGGQRQFAPVLARAAIAAGADGIFLEVHPEPDRALCDGPNSLETGELLQLLPQLKAIRTALSLESI
jgi:2-dehydro-3-deoxyphosphooctonate aldolase (KDO 8-P synthase)